MIVYAYALPPMEHGWAAMPTLDESVNRLRSAEVGSENSPDAAERLLDAFEDAKSRAREEGWEGDFKGEVHVFTIPNKNTALHGFVWMQQSNGETYVATPVELPHLDRVCF